MKKFRFCALCLILAALLSACGRQAAQDVPGAAAVPSPAAVPEAPAESTSTPSPTAPAEIGKEFDDLSFLNEEQRQAYEGAYKLNYTLYGLPDNLVGVAWEAMSSPTTERHWPSTVPSATCVDQPRDRVRSLVAAPSACGSRRSGPAIRRSADNGRRRS